MVEEIPDQDEVFRLVSKPRMLPEEGELLWANVFEFPKGQTESLVWNRYAPTSKDVHDFGLLWQSFVKAKYPDKLMSYAGYVGANVGTIRAFKTNRGHQFFIVHAPENDQGQHHAEIGYKPAEGTPLQPNDKSELKMFLKNVFSTLVPYQEAV